MVRIELRFLAGRYHATPWSSHVNEGAIEWPPSPWRLARALVSVGFAKLGWDDVPDDARALIGRLAATAPAYYLPPASTGHTRHYMQDKTGSSVKVVDAFAYPGRDAALTVEWDLSFTPAEMGLLARLVSGLGYLGRAESWVEAVLEPGHAPQGERCSPAETPPGPDRERVPLLALLGDDAYARWRSAAVDRAVTERLAERRVEARAKGKPEPKALGKADIAKATAFYPDAAFDVLLRDTEELQKQGWREPPGTRWLTYWRVADALAPRASAPRPRTTPHGEVPTVAVLALASDTVHGGALPLFEDALPWCEALHGALVKHLPDPAAGAAWIVTGKVENQPARRGHQHIALHPFASDSGRRFDHVLVHAPAGLDDDALTAIRRTRQLGRAKWQKVRDEPSGDASADSDIALFVSLIGLGARDDLVSTAPPIRSARVWRSVTPYVPPRHLKSQPSGSLERMIIDEVTARPWLTGRVMSVAVEAERQGAADVEFVDASDFWRLWQLQHGRIVGNARADAAGTRLASRWRHFWTTGRRRGKAQPPQRGAFGLEITFDSDVDGPVALGFGCHLGLGLFMPVLQHTTGSPQ